MSKPYYRIGDTYFDTAGKQLYLCTTAGYSTASGLTPVSVWTAIGGGSAQQFTFVSDGGDYIVATPTAGGGNVNIAKPPKLRCSVAQETYVDGTGIHTFTYTAVVSGGVTLAYTRTNTWSAGSQVESITPAYLPGDIIYALAMPVLNMPTAPGAGTNVAVSLLDIHDKDWAV